MFVWQLSGLYAAVFFVAGTKVPFLPVWLEWRGLTLAEIGVVAAAPLFARIAATPAVGFAADRLGDHRRVVIVLAWVALGGSLDDLGSPEARVAIALLVAMAIFGALLARRQFASERSV